MTRAQKMRNAIESIGGVITNQGNPKRIKFTLIAALDEVQENIAEVPGFVIRRDGSGFVAVDLR